MADRLFLGIPLPPESREALVEQLSRGLPRGLPGRSVPPENWHLTLRFLGATPPESAERVRRAMTAPGLGPPFALRLRGLGAFPRPARANVVWLGVGEGAEPLHDLADRVSARMREAGLRDEERPFSPHLTLARLPRPADVRALLGEATDPDLSLAVTEVVLFRSRLGGGPPRYETVERYPL